MGAQNLNPLDELKNLDRQVESITDLAGLKPIFYRLDEIAKQNPDDFEVQLVVGDIKQHLVNRGTRLKEQPAPPGGTGTSTGSPAPTVVVPPRMPSPTGDVQTPRLMSSGQFNPGKPATPSLGGATAVFLAPSDAATADADLASARPGCAAAHGSHAADALSAGKSAPGVPAFRT